MKKLVLLLAAFVLALGLAACNRDISDLQACLDDPSAPECQTACPEGQEIVGTECLAVCPDGEHRDGTDCVIDTINCPSGQHENDGICVLDDTRTPEEVAIDFLIANYDGDMTFLSTALVNMHFEEALTMTSELSFEVTEDIDEVHYIEATVIDSIVYDETNGDMVKRDISIDVDGEVTIDFSVILHEVPTGVHVYIEAAPLIDLITDGDPDMIQTLNWVGFDNQWAVLELDDSLQNVVELAVLKDMVVALFFSEMGEDFFIEVQENLIEPAIGFDLSQYDVNLGLLVDYIIEENWTEVEAQINGVQYENILLHIDAMYLAPRLLEILEENEADLVTAGFNAELLLPMLDVAEWNPTTEMWEPYLPVDPLDGTEAFFQAMDEEDLDALIEVVVKPMAEMMVYQKLNSDANPEWLESDLHNILGMYETFLDANWPVASGSFVLATEQAIIAADGAVIYWQSLSQDEKWVIHGAIDVGYHGWVVHELENSLANPWEYSMFFRRFGEEVDLVWLQSDLTSLLDGSVSYIYDHYGYDVPQWQLDLEAQGVFDWYTTRSGMERQAIVEASEHPGFEWSDTAIAALERIADSPWEYDYHIRFHDENFNEYWFQNDVINLINNHTTYLMDEYSIDGSALIAAIEADGILEWWLNVASEFQREAIREISGFEGEYGPNDWAVENLDRFLQAQGDIYIWFGREDQINQLEDFDYYGEMYATEITPWLTANTSYVGSVWYDEIGDMGFYEWYMQLDIGEKQALHDSLDAHQYSSYRWPVDNMMTLEDEPYNYDICWGNWNYCNNADDMTEELVTLVNDYSMHLSIEYGIDVPALVNAIEASGAVEFYLYEADGMTREALLEIAEQSYWTYEIMWTIEDIIEMEEDLINFLQIHEAELNAAGFSGTSHLADLQAYGIQHYMMNYVDETDVEFLFEEFLYPVLEEFHAAATAEDPEIVEFFVEKIMNNPHMTAILLEIGPNPVFDETIIAANMVAIDFDMLEAEFETFDFEALGQAIYDGQTAYDLYVAGLTLEPNIALFLEILSPAVLSAEEYMVYVDDFNYAIDNLSLFDQFIDLEYYLDDIVDVTPSRTVDAELLLEFEVDGIAYAQLFSDIVDQAGIYLEGFETLPFPFDDEWNCIEPVDCEEPDFATIIATLTTLGSIEAHALYDPNDLTWIELQLDLTDFLNDLVEDEYERISDDSEYVPHEDNDDLTGVNELTFTVTLENESEITLPTNPDNVNEIAEEFAKFAMTMEAYEILKEYAYYYEMNPSMLTALLNTDVYLEDIEFMYFSAAFEQSMSYITISVDELSPGVPDLTTLDFEVVLYWIDGTLVHDDGVGLEEILPLWLDGELVSQASYDLMVAAINETNWHMMKLFTYYLWQDLEFNSPEMD
ncbi:hypothetical protein KQ51_00716 [Candidatus Izimaplasma bacterium HR1]|uniref:hypothetical protein n=1 Tax=Candidatus Izimoplasma sp. HR1 TaxID=1541959 RepID=UPI0004F7C114|nr:hypothetical protein KQ51_00716 [Candidatus Izimaplasma bacterium HR1]